TPGGRDEVRFGGFGILLASGRALVADATHDGVQIRRAGAGLERSIGEFRVEWAVEIHLGSGLATLLRRRCLVDRLLLASQRARDAAEQRARLILFAFLRLDCRRRGGARGGGCSRPLGGAFGPLLCRCLGRDRIDFRRDRGRGYCLAGLGGRGGRILLPLLHRAETVDDLDERVVDRLEGLCVPLVRNPGQVFQTAQFLAQLACERAI